MTPIQTLDMLQMLRILYPKELFDYRRINKAETDGIISNTEAMALRQRYNNG